MERCLKMYCVHSQLHNYLFEMWRFFLGSIECYVYEKKYFDNPLTFTILWENYCITNFGTDFTTFQLKKSKSGFDIRLEGPLEKTNNRNSRRYHKLLLAKIYSRLSICYYKKIISLCKRKRHRASIVSLYIQTTVCKCIASVSSLLSLTIYTLNNTFIVRVVSFVYDVTIAMVRSWKDLTVA